MHFAETEDIGSKCAVFDKNPPAMRKKFSNSVSNSWGRMMGSAAFQKSNWEIQKFQTVKIEKVGQDGVYFSPLCFSHLVLFVRCPCQ
jgi:hypothetical protein